MSFTHRLRSSLRFNHQVRKWVPTRFQNKTTYCLIYLAILTLTTSTLRAPSVARELKSSRWSNVDLDSGYRYYLSACVIVRDSSDILGEFLVRNYIAGVDHFFIYGDDSDTSEVAHLKKLFGVLEGIVTYIENGRAAPLDEEDPERYVQMRMYRHCLQKFGGSSKWVALIDSDEFFETPSSSFRELETDRRPRKAFLHDILMSHEMTPVICVRWKTALTNGRVQPLEYGETLRESFPKTCNKKTGSSDKLDFRKMIVQPRFVDMEKSPKLDVAIHKGLRFRGIMEKLHCKWGIMHQLEPPVYLIHYWSRDLCSFLKKIRRGRPRQGVSPRTLGDLFVRESACQADRERGMRGHKLDDEKRILLRLPVFSTSTCHFSSSGIAFRNQSNSFFKISERRLSKLITKLVVGKRFSNEAYCENRVSAACTISRDKNFSVWPFPWAEYILSLESFENENSFFTSRPTTVG